MAALKPAWEASAQRRRARWPKDPPRPCDCTHIWLTEISWPVNALDAVASACPCCGARAGARCWMAGYVEKPKFDGVGGLGRLAWVYVCPARLYGQGRLL